VPNPLKFLPLLLVQSGKQELARIPETFNAVTENPDDVGEYNRAMETALAVAYAAGLTVIHRARPEQSQRPARALDLASGPGLYTLCLQRYLDYDKVTGLDLSPTMVEAAQNNARARKITARVSFERGDATHLPQKADGLFDLTSFTDAAHHMPDLKTVGQVLTEMDRVTKPDGLVMVMDLARLRTAAITEKYVALLGGDYLKMGLPGFFNQFRDSMYAAWTCAELATAIPQNSRRVWCHLYAKHLPTLQVILGLPVGRQQAFIRQGYPWAAAECPVPSKYRLDWFFARTTLFAATPDYFPATRPLPKPKPRPVVVPSGVRNVAHR
jgi:ubiquinone/menaquinone biosynthesis C-methylase UbiE